MLKLGKLAISKKFNNREYIIYKDNGKYTVYFHFFAFLWLAGNTAFTKKSDAIEHIHDMR